MQHWTFVSALAILLYGSTAQESGSESEWSYENQPRWGGECTTGNMQSPIDLDIDNARTNWRIIPFGSFDSIQFFDYDQRGDGNFNNTGHTVQMNLQFSDPSATPRTVVTTEDSTKTFYFGSLHFHWPSEHTINGQQYDLEMHMVHTSDDGRILVLGYMFHVCRRARSGMGVVGSAVNRLSEAGSSVPISQFAPQRLMPSRLEQCDYFQYNGSLTTPPCTQGVTWLVRQEPLCVEQWQMDAFNAVNDSEDTPMRPNNRTLQDINGRTITYHRCVFVRWWW